jgi:hypothetical protein
MDAQYGRFWGDTQHISVFMTVNCMLCRAEMDAERKAHVAAQNKANAEKRGKAALEWERLQTETRETEAALQRLIRQQRKEAAEQSEGITTSIVSR